MTIGASKRERFVPSRSAPSDSLSLLFIFCRSSVRLGPIWFSRWCNISRSFLFSFSNSLLLSSRSFIDSLIETLSSVSPVGSFCTVSTSFSFSFKTFVIVGSSSCISLGTWDPSSSRETNLSSQPSLLERSMVFEDSGLSFVIGVAWVSSLAVRIRSVASWSPIALFKISFSFLRSSNVRILTLTKFSSFGELGKSPKAFSYNSKTSCRDESTSLFMISGAFSWLALFPLTISFSDLRFSSGNEAKISCTRSVPTLSASMS